MANRGGRRGGSIPPSKAPPKSSAKSGPLPKAGPKPSGRGLGNDEPDSDEDFDRLFGLSPEPERPRADEVRGEGSGEAAAPPLASGSGGGEAATPPIPPFAGPVLLPHSAIVHHRLVYVPGCTPEEFDTMRQRVKYIGREIETMSGILRDLQQDRQRQRAEAWQQCGSGGLILGKEWWERMIRQNKTRHAGSGGSWACTW